MVDGARSSELANGLFLCRTEYHYVELNGLLAFCLKNIISWYEFWELKFFPPFHQVIHVVRADNRLENIVVKQSCCNTMSTTEEGNCFVQIDCVNAGEKMQSYHLMNPNSRMYDKTINISNWYQPFFHRRKLQKLVREIYFSSGIMWHVFLFCFVFNH